MTSSFEALPAEREIVFRLPLPGWPAATFTSTLTYDGGRLLVDGATILEASSRADLERGVHGSVHAGRAADVALQLTSAERGANLRLLVDGQPAPREDQLRAPPSRSAWLHACLALTGSAAGFAASYLYLLKGSAAESDWAMKMGQHMAGWHLLLTVTLFPASVWGQRLGIRVVQWVSLLFFFIHAGIALANLAPTVGADPRDGAIAFWNALSGVLFLTAALYGNRAYRDMDPVAALRRNDAARAAS